MKPLVEEPGNSSYHFFSIFFADLASLIPRAPIGAKGDPQNKTKIGGLNFEKPGKYGEILDENSKRLGIIVYIDLRGF